MTRNKSLGLVLTALVLAAVLISATAHAQTPAGTTIRNQASATFEDLLGNTFMATSNEVTTIVLPVYGVSVIPDDGGGSPPAPPAMTQTAIPGQTVYFSYTLTNTGNDVDSYDIEPLIEGSTSMTLGLGDITIYHDVNGNGVLDGGEPVIVTGPGPGTLGPMNMGDTEFLLVSYQVPPTAVAGEEAYVGLRATSTNDAAQLDERNYHLTTVVSDAVMIAVMSGLPANVDPGAVITYQITGANVGNDDAHGVTVPSVGLTGVLIYDVLPTDPSTGLPLAIASAAGAPGGGSLLYLPAGSPMVGSPETWAWSAAAAVGDIAIAYITNGDITIGQNYSLTYDLDVPLGMPAGIINNSGALAYIDNNAGTPDPTIVTTNNTQVNVNSIADVIVGPNGNPGAGTPPLYNDDIQVIPLAYAASVVDFINTARNDGNFPDEINIVLDGASTIPPAWTVQFFRIDGVTPLSDSGGDMIPDVGTLNPGDTRDFIVRITIPGTETGGAGPYNAVVQAVSAFDPTETNLTTDEITDVSPAAVDIGNYDGVPGTNNATLNQFSDPGLNVDWPLDVINTGGSLDNYTLAATLPPGWTVTFYEDTNGNGVLDLPELTPIASVGPMAAGDEVNIIARVAIPGAEIPGVFNNTFRATSGNNPAVFDEILDTVTINTAAAVTIVPDRNGTATSGGTIRYTHTVTNTGNVSDTWLLSAVSSNGWSYAFFDLLNNPIASVTLNPGVAEDIVVQLSIPGGQPVGTVETGTITVTGSGTGATDNAIDVTTIVAGNLVLAKVVNPPGNQLPGVELTYRTDYSNVGTADMTNILIYDAIPAWTQYRVGSAAQGTLAPGIVGVTIEFSDDGGSTWGYAPASGGGGAPANFDANVTNVRWTLTGTLAGGDGTADGVAFIVRIIAE
jgi:uncharacterized repeat protein (TIGR01451 family)